MKLTIDCNMYQDIKNYLYLLRNISNWLKEYGGLTPYALETQRSRLHYRIFDKYITPYLANPDCNDAYHRSKELFSRLDEIWCIYNAYPLNLNDDECLIQLAKDLCKFLLTTETLLYLEGRTAHIHGINI